MRSLHAGESLLGVKITLHQRGNLFYRTRVAGFDSDLNAILRAQLATVDLVTCQRAAQSVLRADSASAARAIASAELLG